jgi:hypothetical protein
MISRNLAFGARCSSESTAVVTSFWFSMIMLASSLRRAQSSTRRPAEASRLGTSRGSIQWFPDAVPAPGRQG